jgi:hypothetical protein
MVRETISVVVDPMMLKATMPTSEQMTVKKAAKPKDKYSRA